VAIIGWEPVPRGRDYSSEKRLCRLNHVGKSDRPMSLLNRFQLPRDWFARCDALQKFR
jgi:hypothetical protein